jgi:hypothetical protein
MLCIDPHYRTQAGFLQLIQKEWCAFGHKFRTRLALGEAVTSEYSPVFVQWLEAVYQVVRQFPAAFEFTPAILLRLASEVTTNRFGSFLTDCERERNQSVAAHTLSIWSALLSEATSWRNPDYRKQIKPLVPSVSQASFDVWEAYWFRFHPRCQKLRLIPPSITRSPSAPSEIAASSEMAVASASPLGPLASATPSQTNSSTGPPLVEASEQDRAPPADPLGAKATTPATEVSLFTDEEIASAAPKAKPKQYFQDDDDDKDEGIFSEKK